MYYKNYESTILKSALLQQHIFADMLNILLTLLDLKA